MALIKCEECRKKISNRADSCPHCGCPVAKPSPTNNSTSEIPNGVDHSCEPTKKHKKPKLWLLIIGICILLAFITVITIFWLDSRYNWEDVILKSAIPEPPSKYGNLQGNTADKMFLIVHKVSFAEYENYLKSCIERGYIHDVESSASSYTAFNSEGYELDLGYYHYQDSFYISINARIAGTIKWSNGKLAAFLPVPESNLGSVIQDHDHGYEAYVGNMTKQAFDTYISECRAKGFNFDVQEQAYVFHAKNDLGYELTVKYFESNLIHINLNVPTTVPDHDTIEPTSTTTEQQVTTNSKDNSDTSKSTTRSTSVCVECGKDAYHTYTNFISGQEEYYCYTHYQEIIGIISMMENDVGNSSQSKHTCAECSREGTHEYNSFTGQVEYYCTQHYEELKDMLEILGWN